MSRNKFSNICNLKLRYGLNWLIYHRFQKLVISCDYWYYDYFSSLFIVISACELVASRIFFDDDSCPDSYKYMKVCYECAYDESNAVDILKMQKRRRKRKRGTLASYSETFWFCSIEIVFYFWSSTKTVNNDKYMFNTRWYFCCVLNACLGQKFQNKM